MACYRTCLQFHDHQLAKGVFMQAKAFTVDNPHRVLWFALAPDEIAAALGVVHLGFDSLSNKEAYRLLGNMLAPVHSAFQWLRIAQIWTSVISNDLRLPQLEPFCQEFANLCSQAIQIHKDANETTIPVTLSATEPFIVWNLVVKTEAKQRKDHFKARLALEAKKGNTMLLQLLASKGRPKVMPSCPSTRLLLFHVACLPRLVTPRSWCGISMDFTCTFRLFQVCAQQLEL